MDAVKFLEEYKRMCNNYEKCKGCPISTCRLADGTFFCNSFIKWHAEKAVTLVEKWSEEHPQKTILDDFKEKYPNAKYVKNGYPKVCPKLLGYKIECDEECRFCDYDYDKVWNTPLEEATK